MIKPYIITMIQNDMSMKAARRCIKSASKFGYYPEIFNAITPDSNPKDIFMKEQLSLSSFTVNTSYSKMEPAMCCFLSHRELWKKCFLDNKTIIVLEHDAVFVDKIQNNTMLHKFVNLGKPSYGGFMRPKVEAHGIYELFSKTGGYLPGTHAYMVTPDAAKELLQKAKTNPAPADLFLNKSSFPWMMESFPWPIEADDRFTTIQKPNGCVAKHAFSKEYIIEDVERKWKR